MASYRAWLIDQVSGIIREGLERDIDGTYTYEYAQELNSDGWEGIERNLPNNSWLVLDPVHLDEDDLRQAWDRAHLPLSAIAF